MGDCTGEGGGRGGRGHALGSLVWRQAKPNPGADMEALMAMGGAPAAAAPAKAEEDNLYD